MDLPGSIFNCRLCWRITLVIFALILAIEIIILIPSAWYFMESEQQRLIRDARLLVDPVLARSNDTGADMSSDLDMLIDQHGLLGVAIYDDSGKSISSAGKTVPITANDINGSSTVSTTTIADNNHLVATWNSRYQPGWSIVAKMDTSYVSQHVYDYIFRVAGLVAIIVIFVTVGTMLILNIGVLKPLLSLRKSAIAAGQTPHRSSEFALKTNRNDEIGELISAYNLMLDQVSESHRRERGLAEQQAKYLTQYDQITGLPNQNSLEEFIDQQIKLNKKIILIQLRFRHIRLLDGTYGNGIKNEVVRTIAERLKNAASPGDFLARLEGGRFIISRSDNNTLSQAVSLAEYFLTIAEQPFRLNRKDEFSFTVYAGIALSNHKNVPGKELLAQTDMALTGIHEDNHDKYAFYSPQHAEETRYKQTLLRDLERALMQNELFIVLQPKVELQPHCAHTLAGAEVLVRWQHPEHGLMSPAEFIPIAESSGLINKLGDFVLSSASRSIRNWTDRYGWSPRLSINIAGKEFSQPDLIARIQKVLNQYHIPSELIELEITENTSILDTEYTARTFSDLHNIGVKISLDDFGIGYSSLSYLRRLYVDAIKIDKSFVEDIGLNADAEAICVAILKLGRILGVRVIAEGVENRQQLDFLCKRKFDEAQGYLLGKPVTTDIFEQTWFMLKDDNNRPTYRSIA